MPPLSRSPSAPPGAHGCVFGKIRAAADFVRIRANDGVGRVVQKFLLEANDRVTERGIALSPEPIHFVLSDASESDTFAIGVMVASTDAVGRSFPIAIWSEISVSEVGGRPGLLPFVAQTYFESVEELALHATDLELDVLEVAARALPLPLSEMPGGIAVCREARAHERASAFIERSVGAVASGQPHYAFYAMLEAARGVIGRPPKTTNVVLDCPITIDVDLFAWLTVVGEILDWSTLPSFAWAMERPRLLVCLGPPDPSLLVYLMRPGVDAPRLWPLRTESAIAIGKARSTLPRALLDAIEGDVSLGELFDATVGAARR